MVATDGAIVDLATLLDGLSHARNATPGLTITVQDIELLATSHDLVAARFTEIHAGGDEATSRRVTALLQPDGRARNGLLWRHVHETALPPDHRTTS